MRHDCFLIDNCFVWLPSGDMTSEKLEETINCVDFQEQVRGESLNRLIDCTYLVDVSISYENISTAALRRSISGENYQNTIKIAFLVSDDRQFAFANMYRMLIHSDRIVIRVFKHRPDALLWLEIDAEMYNQKTQEVVSVVRQA